MAERPLEDLLLLWGIAYGEPGLAVEHGRRVSRIVYHPIAEGMTFAPGKRPKRLTKTMLNRDGRSRRTYMAQKMGLKGMVGMEFVDPVRGKQSNSGGAAEPIWSAPPELVRIERAVQALEDMAPLRGLCMRANYCVKGDQAEKLDWITDRIRRVSRYHEPVKLKRFRDELAHARFFVTGYLAANAERAA